MKKVAMSLALLALSSFYTGAFAADSPCKGLENAACTKSPACGWVKSYTTKKGKTIEAFCRKKSTPKPKA
ncbi:MAG: hypothetical protein SGJ17_05550 [Hyphomicrobiales bacterium]|nr:hypothetical protein [Hyphomicrobiales bacterium]